VTLDTWLLLTVNALARATPWLQPVMLAYGSHGVVVFAALMLAGWWLARRRADLPAVAAALWAPVGLLLALAVNQPLSTYFGAPRPYLLYPDLLVLAQHSLAPGFPSDHAVMAGAVAAGVFAVNRRLGWWTVLAALLMGFARIYIAAAFPRDVLVGLLVGAAVSLVGYLLVRRVLVRLLSLAEPTVFRPLITAAPRPEPRAAQLAPADATPAGASPAGT
jgi:membrane-associated phospholipid phosphatase